MSFSKELLNFINEAGVFVPRIETPYAHIRRIRKSSYYGALDRLEKQKYIVKRKTGQGLAFSITAEGKSLLKEKTVAKKRKDGFSTIVTFDIPEEKRKARVILRKYLIKNGFIPLQKSVYISRNKVPGKIVDLVRELELNANVSVIGGKIEYYL